MTKVLSLSILTLACCLLIACPKTETEPPEPAKPTNPPCAEAGPQSPRNIDRTAGTNPVDFEWAPPDSEMNLCNIHFHKFAEHKAKAYSKKLGKGEHAGWACAGYEPASAAGADHDEGEDHGGCAGVGVGDTIEVHWVYSTCDVKPGEGLGSCGTCENQRLRVEASVFYLTDDAGFDFAPAATDRVQYKGSTTGTKYDNKTCSPAQVTWNVTRECTPLTLASLNDWCDNDGTKIYKENHAHGVRKLVRDQAFLSEIR